MNTRTILQAALGLRGLFPSFFTRTAMTAVLVAPALWAHVETQIIAVADPEGAKSKPPDGISLLHGALTGVLPQNPNPSASAQKNGKTALTSPLENEFQALLAETTARSGGDGGSLLGAFKGFFGNMSSPAADPGSAQVDGNGIWPLGTLGPLGAGFLVSADRLATGQPSPTFSSETLVPINEAIKPFDGEVNDESSLPTRPWIAADAHAIADPAAMAPPPEPLSGDSESGRWNANADGSPWTPPQNEAESFSPSESAGSVGFRTSSISNGPSISPPTPINLMPQVSHSIVLASAPVASSNSVPAAVSAAALSIPAASITTTSSNLQVTPNLSVNINYQFVTVGNAGNANDPITGLGGVSYAYNIGKYDVTLTQYAQFLNAVASVGGTAASDPYGLYNSQMDSDVTVEGISRTVSNGNYVYTVVGDGSRPVTYVSWFDAARLANWMQNGQPTGVVEGPTAATETGAYTLSGATSGVILKNSNATYWIPSESEWYKAAYYDPTLNSGAGGYWQFATRSNTFPGNNAQSPTTANQANYYNGVYSVTQSSETPVDNPTNYLTDVGEFTNSASYYGTFDQNGLVYQWTDLVADSNTERGERGGSWQTGASAFYTLTASDAGIAPGEENAGLGIRLASAVAVPEPTVASLSLAGGLLLIRRKRSRVA